MRSRDLRAAVRAARALQWSPKLLELLIEELYIDETLETLLGTRLSGLPQRRYPEAIAVALRRRIVDAYDVVVRAAHPRRRPARPVACVGDYGPTKSLRLAGLKAQPRCARQPPAVRSESGQRAPDNS
jgi:hypothetical protein